MLSLQWIIILVGAFTTTVMTITYPYMLAAPWYVVLAWAGVLGSGSIVLIDMIYKCTLR